MKQVTEFLPRLADQELAEIQNNEYAQAFIAQINNGEPMPTVSEMGQLWSIHTNNIRSMWSGEQTAQQAADNMVSQLKEAIGINEFRKVVGYEKEKDALGYTYLAPALISILLVTCLPIIYTVILSFTNYNMYHLNDYSYVGWENYRTVFSGSIKSVFFPVLGWTVCSAVLSTAGAYARDWYLPFY